jgi:hypothetical protein
MNFALFAQFARWLFSARVPTQHTAFAAQPQHPIHVLRPRVLNPAMADKPRFLAPKPLRVVRVMEAGQARSSVGRMVISGRMADVCAELDRLAAREAALS